MRLWSLHPRYLDTKGLVALWRESLLAQKVLVGETKGYRHHPQLIRFREQESPLEMIGSYLQLVWEEANERGFQFNQEKIIHSELHLALPSIPITTGQLSFEWNWLCRKVQQRDPEHYKKINQLRICEVDPHPLFELCEGKIADWEKTR